MSLTPRNRPHLYLKNKNRFRKSINYMSPRRGSTPKPPERDRAEHAAKLENAIGEAITKADQQFLMNEILTVEQL